MGAYCHRTKHAAAPRLDEGGTGWRATGFRTVIKSVESMVPGSETVVDQRSPSDSPIKEHPLLCRKIRQPSQRRPDGHEARREGDVAFAIVWLG